MNCYTYVGHKLGRELAEMAVYMKLDFEMEHIDDPSDPYHSYGLVTAYTADGTPQDYRFQIAADCPEDLKELWADAERLIRHYVLLITTNPIEHK